MRCIVCGKEYERDQCPVCNFPEIHFPGDYEAGLAAIAPTVKTFREQFLRRVQIGVRAYGWKEENGAYVAAEDVTLPFGAGDRLSSETVWLEESFARLPQEEALQVRIVATVDGAAYEKTVAVPNLPQAKLQNLGACLDETLHLQLFLRNASATSESQKTLLFE